MSLKGKHLYILTPMYGGFLTVNYHSSFISLCAQTQAAGVELGSNNIYNESLISRARNRLVDNFLKDTAATHACFIDADIGFDPRDILLMLEMDKDILGVPCSKKSINWERIQYAIARRVFEWQRDIGHPAGTEPDALASMFKQSGKAFSGQDLPRIGGDFVLNLLNQNATIRLDTPEPMKHLGTGLLMVKREVFLKFMKTYPDRWYESRADANSNPGRIHDFFKCGINQETREYDSEDYWFIANCIAMGYEALLCPWVKTTHMGTFSFVGDMAAALACSGTIF